MSEQQPDHARRLLLCAIAVSPALLFRGPEAHATDKMTLREAEYQNTPNGIYSCGMCTFFEAPTSCKVVDGNVSRDGWCKIFAAVD